MSTLPADLSSGYSYRGQYYSNEAGADAAASSDSSPSQALAAAQASASSASDQSLASSQAGASSAIDMTGFVAIELHAWGEYLLVEG